MDRRHFLPSSGAACLFGIVPHVLLVSPTAAIDTQQNLTGDAEQGEYVVAMAGCMACHTDTENGGKPLAGGVAIESPFGTFYSPNITSDPTAGIGAWSTSRHG